MDLLARNLNTLPVLRALLEQASVAGAARQVGLSQPTVSGILATLRSQFDDPLLVRDGRRMRLTPRAERLLPRVVEVCTSLALLFEPERVDAARLDRTFIIAAPDHLAFLLTPALLDMLEREAPGVRLRFVDVAHDLESAMDTARVDLAVCANFALWPGLRFAPLFEEHIVAAMWAEHPLAGAPSLSRAELLAYPIIAMDSTLPVRPGGSNGRGRTGVPTLDDEGRISLSQFTDAVLLAVGTDIVVAAPVALVDRLAAVLPVVGVPLADIAPIRTGSFWIAARDHDRELEWLRGLVARATAGW